MNEKTWLSVSETSVMIDVPAETVRRYVRQHGKWLRLEKDGKRYLIHRESVKIIEEIRELYSQNHTIKEVDDRLSESGLSMTVTVHDGDERVTVSVADELIKLNQALEQQNQFNQALLEGLKEQRDYIQRLENELQLRDQQQKALTEAREDADNRRDERLMNEIKQQQEEIKQAISTRDERLMSAIREIQEQKKAMECTASEDKEMKKSFWGRLLGK